MVPVPRGALAACLLICACALGPAARGADFQVADFGARGDGRTDDGPALRRALAAALASPPPARLLFEPKTYRLEPYAPAWEQLTLAKAQRLTLDGRGARLLLHPANRAFRVEDSTSCTIENFTLDYAPLPFTQGTIENIDAKAGAFEYRLAPGYPALPPQAWMERHHNGNWRFGSVLEPRRRQFSQRLFGGHLGIKRIDALATGSLYRVSIADAAQLKDVAPGDRFVVRVYYTDAAQNDARTGLPIACFQLTRSSGITLRGITQHTAPAMWIHLQDNLGPITIDTCRLTYPTTGTRLITSLSDGIHCKAQRAGITVRNCLFEGLQDDSINISVMEDAIMEARGPNEFKTISREIAWFDSALRVGDELLAFDRVRGVALGHTRVTDILGREGGHIRIFRTDRPVTPNGFWSMENPEKYTTFYNLSAAGLGYKIIGNTFRTQMRSAMNLRGGEGLIEGNTIHDLGGCGIYLNNDLHFGEGPFPSHVVVRGNTIRGLRMNPGIAISAAALGPVPEPLIEHITIEENSVATLGPHPPIAVFGARDVVIQRNKLRHRPGTEAVVQRDSRNVTLRDNQIAVEVQKP